MSIIPTANLLISFSKEAINFINQNVVTFGELQLKVEQLNAKGDLQAYLFGTGPNGNLLEFIHETNFSEKSVGPDKESYARFKIRILDPKNIFEKIFITNFYKSYNEQEILNFAKDRNASGISLPKDVEVPVGQLGPEDQVYELGPIYTDTNPTTGITNKTEVKAKVIRKPVLAPFSKGLPTLYLAYGCGTNLIDWAGPFIGQMSKIDYNYIENGIRTLDMEFLATFGPSLRELNNLDALDVALQWNPKVSVLKSKNNKINAQNIIAGIEGLDKTRNDILFARTSRNDLLQDQLNLQNEVDTLNFKLLDASSQLSANNVILQNDSPSAFITYVNAFIGNPIPKAIVSNFLNTVPPLPSEKTGMDYGDRVIYTFEQTVLTSSISGGDTTITNNTIREAYNILIDSLTGYSKNIFLLQSDNNLILAQIQKLNKQINEDNAELININNALNSIVDSLTQDLQNRLRDEGFTNTLDQLQLQSDILKSRLTADNEFKDLDFIIWEAMTNYINTFNQGSRRTLFMIPSVYSIMPDFINRVTKEIDIRFKATTGDTLSPDIPFGAYNSRIEYFKKLAIYSVVLNQLGFSIEIDDKSRTEGIWHPISWETAKRESVTATEENSPLEQPRISLENSLLSKISKNNKDFVYYTDVDIFASIYKVQGQKYFQRISEFFERLRELSQKEINSIWFYEYNFNYIDFFEQLFDSNTIKSTINLDKKLIESDEDKRETKPITIVGDPDLIYRFLYFPEIKSARESPNTYIKYLLNDKKDLYLFGEPWITIFKTTPITSKLPRLPIGGVFGDISSPPDEYSFTDDIFTNDLKNIIKINKIPVFKYGTSNPNVLRSDFNLGVYYDVALRAVQSIAPLTGFLNLLDKDELAILADPKKQKLKNLNPGKVKDLIIKLIQIRRKTGISLEEFDNFNPSQRESISEDEQIPSIIELLGLDNIPQEQLLEIFSQLEKNIVSNENKDLPIRFTNIFKTNNVESQILELLRRVTMNKITGTITTLPYFRLSSFANTFNSDCIFLNQEPRIVNKHGEIEKINRILSGVYKIYGFKHEISMSKIQSSFFLQKKP